MTVHTYGSLTETSVQQSLQKAQLRPGEWTVYLVHGNSDKRTPAQNRLFRRLVQKLAQQQGKSVEYWTEFLVERFLGYEEVGTEDGYTRMVLTSTSELSVAEFSSFLNACLVFASELQVH